MSINASAGSEAIEAFKAQSKVQAFLKDKSEDKYWVRFDEIELGSICGFAGCQWQKLVSMVVISKSSNAPSLSFFAVVEGPVPVAKGEPTVRFVEMSDMDPEKWKQRL